MRDFFVESALKAGREVVGEFVHAFGVEHGESLGGDGGGEAGGAGEVAFGGVEVGEDGEFDGAFCVDVDGAAVGGVAGGGAPDVAGLRGGGEDGVGHFWSDGWAAEVELHLLGEDEVAVPDFFGSEAA